MTFRNLKNCTTLNSKPLKKGLYLLLGTLSLVLAYIGVIMPGIPGIPFIILTAWFYMRSSDRLYRWLIDRSLLGRILRKFTTGKNVSKSFKWLVVSQLWVSITVACVYLIHRNEYRIAAVAAGILVSMLIMRMKRVDYW